MVKSLFVSKYLLTNSLTLHFFRMFILSKAALSISSGPKDISRHPFIRSITEEANLKSKSYRIQKNEFDAGLIMDCNIIIFDTTKMTESDYNNILECANITWIYVFGTNDDTWLHKLIPAAESYSKWLSVCEYCFNAAAFDLHGTIVCRPCRREIIEIDQKKSNGAKRSGKENNKRKRSDKSSSSSVECIEAKSTKLDTTCPSLESLPIWDESIIESPLKESNKV